MPEERIKCILYSCKQTVLLAQSETCGRGVRDTALICSIPSALAPICFIFSCFNSVFFVLRSVCSAVAFSLAQPRPGYRWLQIWQTCCTRSQSLNPIPISRHFTKRSLWRPHVNCQRFSSDQRLDSTRPDQTRLD